MPCESWMRHKAMRATQKVNIQKAEQAARDLTTDSIMLERRRRLKIDPEIYAAYERLQKKKRAQRDGNPD